MFDQLIAAVSRRDFAGALELALEAWRATLASELAELVDALAARGPRRELPKKPDLAGYQAAYLELAGDLASDASGALASGFTARLSHEGHRLAWWQARLAALIARPSDPRIAHALARTIAAAPWTGYRDEAGYRATFAALATIGDARCAALLRHTIDHPTAKAFGTRNLIAREAATTAAAIDARIAAGSPIDPRTASELARLLGELGVRKVGHRALDDLLAEVYAAPDDDGAREVYADALTEHGDPRGEFIVLQLRAEREPLKPAEHARMAALLRSHERAWIGRLAAITKRRVFRRGFLDAAELERTSAAEPDTWARAVTDPTLHTVRALHKGGANAARYAEFVTSPCTTALCDITVPTPRYLREWSELAKPFASVALDSTLSGTALTALTKALPKLGARRLRVTVAETPWGLIEWLSSWPGRNALDELCVRPTDRARVEWRRDFGRWLTAHPRMAPVRRLAVELVTLAAVCETAEDGGLMITVDTSDYDFLALAEVPFTRLTINGKPRQPLSTLHQPIWQRFPRDRVDLSAGWRAVLSVNDPDGDGDPARTTRRPG